MPERTHVTTRGRCIAIHLIVITIMSCPGSPAVLAAEDGNDRADGLYRLAARGYPEGVKDETGYARWMTARLDRLEAQLAQTKGTEARTQLLIAQANFRLARQAEPALSRMLLGDNSKPTLQSLGHAAEEALNELTQAGKLVDRLDKGKPKDKILARKIESWQQAITQLRPLGVAMASLATGEGLDRAIAALKPLVEGKPAKASPMAGLLHKALLLRAGKGQELLDTTEVALVPPKTLPYDFFARLLRCRGLTSLGHRALAAALGAQLDTACEGWMDKTRLPETKRAVMLLRIDVSRGWAEALQKAGLEAEARARREAADQLRKTLTAQEDVGAYRLVLAAPILVEPPPPPKPKPAPPRPTTSRSGSQPTTAKTATRPSTSEATTRSKEEASPTRPATTQSADQDPSGKR